MAHHHEHDCSCHSHSHQNCACRQEFNEEDHIEGFKQFISVIISFLLLITGIFFDNQEFVFFKGFVRIIWYFSAYCVVAFPVIKNMLLCFAQKDFFNEFSLMSLATIGALLIGEYPEAVGVMLFYTVGEILQESAVNRAKRSIKALLDIRPDKASVLRKNIFMEVNPQEIRIGETIQVKVGEKVPLDGKLLNTSSFNTSALTGESVPRKIRKGEQVLAGMINLDYVVEIEVAREYADSSLAKILYLAQNAMSRKAKTELFIKRFAKIYTPLVFALACMITFLPALFVDNYHFADWLYRGLVFLVISCPCALVISVPLGYFSGIGVASKYGILFKGANFLELMTKITHIAFDKTGTLTKGVFAVQKVESVILPESEFIKIVASVEKNSNHPVAKAMAECAANAELPTATDIKEISGHGISAAVEGKSVLAGNGKLLKMFEVDYDQKLDDIVQTTVFVAIDGVFAGYFVIADEEKKDVKSTISILKNKGIRTILLSGDKQNIVRQTAANLDIDEAYGDMLPENKVVAIEKIKTATDSVVAYCGDGINDTPSLAMSDVSIAMGSLSSQAVIEIADVIIQTDAPERILTAINISKATNNIIFQNIILALSIKFAVLILGAIGYASMWAAVFADVGVALLAIANSIRLFFKKFE
ncbi:MAG: cadmium-translocating P-type ATPase [Prevotellaceae bacterium]|jgi:Cd2+/Zn2+-exporting ATPase|nr:cadmium-translocating P-type ATPase [Prevotellaceae bacterium]